MIDGFHISEPEELGFNADLIGLAEMALARGLDEGLYTGAVLCIARHNSLIRPLILGSLRASKNNPVAFDTIFDLASLTKPIATASSILLLATVGELHLEQSAEYYFKKRQHLSDITLSHLLTHTSGLPAYIDIDPFVADDHWVEETILDTKPTTTAGDAYLYSCLGYILLAKIVEVAAGQSFDSFVRDYIFTPLAMHDTGFLPTTHKLPRIAATCNTANENGPRVGEVHDPLCSALGGVAGNAGLFSSAADLLRYCLELSTGASGIFDLNALKLMFTNLIDPEIGGQSAGWFIFPNQMISGGECFSKQAIGHTGFTGTSIVIDPEYDLLVILLTNRVCSSDDGVNFRRVRHYIHRSVAQAVIGR